jgi:1,4-dihydroxy-2-naphthoate octaprenyltransferase
LRYLRLFLKLSRPLFILIASLLYLLGAGISHYLNGYVDWLPLLLGSVLVLLILLAFTYLNEYFEVEKMRETYPWWLTPFSGASGAIGKDKLSRQVALWAGLTCLTVASSLTVLLFQFHHLNSLTIFILGFIFIFEMLFAIPPLRLVSSGYGEVVMSITRVGLIPAFAFLLQGDGMHRLLIMVAFPLVLLHFSMLLALELPAYAADLKHENSSMIVRIGWQRGMITHNLFVLGSFVVFGIAFLLGLPLSVGWPVLLVLPLGVFQVVMMNRISEGAKPNWSLLTLTALSSFCLAAYILTFAFWTH